MVNDRPVVSVVRACSEALTRTGRAYGSAGRTVP